MKGFLYIAYCSLALLLVACSTRSNGYGLLKFSGKKPERHTVRKREAPKHQDMAIASDSSVNHSSFDSVSLSDIFKVSLREDEMVDHQAAHHVRKTHQDMEYYATPAVIASTSRALGGKSELSEDWWATLAFVLLVASVIAIGALFFLALAPAIYNIVNALSLLSIIVGDILLSVSNKHVATGMNKRTFFNKAANIITKVVSIAFLALVLYYVISIL